MWLTSSIPAEFREPGRVEELLEQAIAAFQSTACEAPSLPHLSPTTFKTLYAFAYRFYRDGVYDKAADFFRFLCLMKLDEKKHWVGLGAAEHMRGNYDQALQAYAMAALLDASDPFPHFHAAECYVKQRDITNAHRALDIAERYATGNARRTQLRQHIALMRSQWPRTKES